MAGYHAAVDSSPTDPTDPIDRATAIEARIKHPGYELFIIGLSIFSIANLALLLLPMDPATKEAVTIVDGLLSLVFFADFGYRLATAPDRRAYLRFGWTDFVGAFPWPGFRIFRLVRVVHAIRVMRAAGGRSVVRDLVRDRGETAIFMVFLIAIVVLELSSIVMVAVEADDPRANIRTGGEALWWAFVSVTTVGYGDFYPVTGAGRLVGSVLLAVGIGLFSTITGFLATRLTSRTGIHDGPEAVRQADAERRAHAEIASRAGPAGRAERDL